jgi:hypothetical protein
MLGNYRVAEHLVASRVVLSSIELVVSYCGIFNTAVQTRQQWFVFTTTHIYLPQSLKLQTAKIIKHRTKAWSRDNSRYNGAGL